jgi:hypothetical protein
VSDRARRLFVVAWLALVLAGALHLDVGLPFTKYPHVMFNRNLRSAQVYTFARADGARHDLAELVPTPALGYRRARIALDLIIKPARLAELCAHAMQTEPAPLTFFVEQWRIEPGARQLERTTTLRCDANGLQPL